MQGRQVQGTAEAPAISQLITGALTAIEAATTPAAVGRTAMLLLTVPGDAAAGIAWPQILVRVQLPGEGPRS